MGKEWSKEVEGVTQVAEVGRCKEVEGGIQVAEHGHCNMGRANQDKQVAHTHGPLAAEAGNDSQQEVHDKVAVLMNHM